MIAVPQYEVLGQLLIDIDMRVAVLVSDFNFDCDTKPLVKETVWAGGSIRGNSDLKIRPCELRLLFPARLCILTPKRVIELK